MIQVTEAEWRIMECLWDHAPQAMSEITRTLDPSTHAAHGHHVVEAIDGERCGQCGKQWLCESLYSPDQ